DEQCVLGHLGHLRGDLVRAVAPDADLRRADDGAAADRDQCLAGHAGGECRFSGAGARAEAAARQDAQQNLPAVHPALFFLRRAPVRLYQASVPVTPMERGSVTNPEIEPGWSVVLLRMDHDL